MPDNKLRVGFIGIGAMGTPMSQRIWETGFPLTVYNRWPAKTEAFAAKGFQWRLAMPILPAGRMW